VSRLRLVLIGLGLLLAAIGLARESRPVIWAAIIALGLAVLLRLVLRTTRH
jgi:hypothetical protein